MVKRIRIISAAVVLGNEPEECTCIKARMSVRKKFLICSLEEAWVEVEVAEEDLAFTFKVMDSVRACNFGSSVNAVAAKASAERRNSNNSNQVSECSFSYCQSF